VQPKKRSSGVSVMVDSQPSDQRGVVEYRIYSRTSRKIYNLSDGGKFGGSTYIGFKVFDQKL